MKPSMTYTHGWLPVAPDGVSLKVESHTAIHYFCHRGRAWLKCLVCSPTCCQCLDTRCLLGDCLPFAGCQGDW